MIIIILVIHRKSYLFKYFYLFDFVWLSKFSAKRNIARTHPFIAVFYSSDHFVNRVEIHKTTSFCGIFTALEQYFTIANSIR